jgi:tight adherence protein B
VIVSLLAALAVAGAIVLFGLSFTRRRQYKPTERRLHTLNEEPPPEKRGLSWDEVRRRGPSTLPYLRDWLLQSAWAQRMATQLEAAGLKLRVGEYVIIRFGLLFGGILVVWALNRTAIGFILGIALGLIGFMLPAVYVSSMRRRRIEQISRQLPEATQMISSALRAGFAFQHGIQMVSEQLDPPMSDEFIRMVVDLNVGSSVEEALQGLLSRCDTEEMNLLVTAVLVQRTSGGNLSEILENVGEQLREKERLVGEVRTMTAQQRFSGSVMAIWPLLLLGIFSVVNWDQTSLLFTTSGGLAMLAVGAGLQLFGYFTIRRILDIEV